MARDKLITIRIEGEKRDAFNQLAKSQNTDTASLLYDFINQCLDGRIDISLVTGKKQWIDKIDNQLDTNRLDKLEATTQRIDRIDIAIQRLDNRIDGIETITQRLAKRLDDWIEAIDDRLTDCDQLLSNKITSLEHRLNALSIQLDSQQDSQLDRQQENPDMGTVVTVEAADKDKPVTDAIGPVPGDSPQLKNQPSEAVDIENRQGLTNDQLSKKIGIPTSTIEKWKGKIREGKEITSTKYPKFFKQWTLNLADSLWYEV
ncbi:MAG: hypothetical protein IM473_22030 [Microcystis sp. M015S2]|uniref:hypothetical protein n=1 Tax=unclassified Microcystis TaxID=2643300 RepID=UPI00258740A4|nr:MULTISPECIES: hypothetical protein [unclassified Microcystis]MCA2710002.1 hypothetical protein [Microcystis sp. M025S2]MCA2744978.1 hypothetical protein [Microcystis sp. M015S2]MCA2760570.1 hypothetical protein [Microcystis sp. M145S2]